MKKDVWMFAGQGSQYYHMGRELYERDNAFRDYFQRGDERVRKLTGVSLAEVVYDPRQSRSAPFQRTLYSHPAIVLFECALAWSLRSHGLSPGLVLGYSLGELTCMVVSESISLEEALGIAVQQAQLLEASASPGGMMAILERAEWLERFPEEFALCEIAGLNFPGNVVISGPVDALKRAQRFLKEKGINFVELPVAYGFHSRGMDAIEGPFKRLLKELKPRRPSIPVISAVRCGRVEEFTADHLWAATRHSIDLSRTIRELERNGPHRYLDLGPSGSMATAVKYNLNGDSRSEFAALATPFGREMQALNRLLGGRVG